MAAGAIPRQILKGDGNPFFGTFWSQNSSLPDDIATAGGPLFFIGDPATFLPIDPNAPGIVVGVAARPASSSFSRPANTTAYTIGDLVANSVTAGSVVAMQFTAGRVNAGSGMVRRAKLLKGGTTVTNASFRLHLYSVDPALSTGISNGDNSAWLTKKAGYIGFIDIVVDKAFSDGSSGAGAPTVGSEITFVCGAGTQLIYGLLEARAAYGPDSAETWIVELEVLQN